MLRGERIGLRQIVRADLPLLEAWAGDPDFEGEYGSFGLRNTATLERNFAETGFLSTRSGQLLIVNLDGEPLGDVTYHQQRYGPNEGSITYNIGIALAPRHRGKGYGVEAQALLAAYLFDTYPIMRVEASTDITNIPEQHALEKAGFTREGIARKAQWRSGAWHDLVLYSKLRGE